MSRLNFGKALEELKSGGRVARSGWNGKGMWLQMVRSDAWSMSSDALSSDSRLGLLPWVGMKTADDNFIPWLASQTDILSEDWEILE